MIYEFMCIHFVERLITLSVISIEYPGIYLHIGVYIRNKNQYNLE